MLSSISGRDDKYSKSSEKEVVIKDLWKSPHNSWPSSNESVQTKWEKEEGIMVEKMLTVFNISLISGQGLQDNLFKL